MSWRDCIPHCGHAGCAPIVCDQIGTEGHQRTATNNLQAQPSSVDEPARLLCRLHMKTMEPFSVRLPNQSLMPHRPHRGMQKPRRLSSKEFNFLPAPPHPFPPIPTHTLGHNSVGASLRVTLPAQWLAASQVSGSSIQAHTLWGTFVKWWLATSQPTPQCFFEGAGRTKASHSID